MQVDTPSIIVPPKTLEPVKDAGMTTPTILLMILLTFLALAGFVVLVLWILNTIRTA